MANQEIKGHEAKGNEVADAKDAKTQEKKAEAKEQRRAEEARERAGSHNRSDQSQANALDQRGRDLAEAARLAREEEERQKKVALLKASAWRVWLNKIVGKDSGEARDPRVEMGIDKVIAIVEKGEELTKKDIEEVAGFVDKSIKEPTKEELAGIVVALDPLKDTSEDAKEVAADFEKVILQVAENNEISRTDLKEEETRIREAQLPIRVDTEAQITENKVIHLEPEPAEMIKFPLQRQEELQAAERDGNLIPEPQVITIDSASESINTVVQEVKDTPTNKAESIVELQSLVGLLEPGDLQAKAGKLVGRLEGKEREVGKPVTLPELPTDSVVEELVSFIPVGSKKLSEPEQAVIATAQKVLIHELVDRGVDTGEVTEKIEKKVSRKKQERDTTPTREEALAAGAKEIKGGVDVDQEEREREILSGVRNRASQEHDVMVVKGLVSVFDPTSENHNPDAALRLADGRDKSLEMERHRELGEAVEQRLTSEVIIDMMKRALAEVPTGRNEDENRALRAQYEAKMAADIHYMKVLMRMLEPLIQSKPHIITEAKFNEYVVDMRAIDNAANLNERRGLVADFALRFREHFKDPELGGSERIECVEDFVGFIASMETGDFRIGGAFELMRRNEVGEMEVVIEHVFAYIRHRALFFKGLNPDSPIDLEQNIYWPGLYRTITLYEALRTDKFWRRRRHAGEALGGAIYDPTKTPDERKAQYESINGPKAPLERGKDGDRTLKPGEQLVAKEFKEGINYISDERLMNLKNALTFEAWHINEWHNKDTKYRLVQGNLQKILEFMVNEYWFNYMTASKDRFHRILKFTGIRDKIGMEQTLKHESAEKWRVPGKVGRIIRRTLNAYRFLADKEMFEKVLDSRIEGRQDALDVFFKTAINGVFQEAVDDYNERYGRTIEERDADGNRIVIRRGLGEIKNIFDILDPAHPNQALINQRFAALYDRILFHESVDRNDNTRFNISAAEFRALLQSTDDNLNRFARHAMSYRYHNKNAKWASFVDLGPGDPIPPGSPEGTVRMEQFIMAFNIATKQNLDSRLRKNVKEAIRQAVKKAEGLLMDKETEGENAFKADDLDSVFGNEMATSGISWTGIQAALDVTATAFDKWGNLLNTMEYLLGQPGKGKIGMRERLMLVRRLTVTPFDFIKVRIKGRDASDMTLGEMLLGTSHKNATDITDPEIEVNLDFDEKWLAPGASDDDRANAKKYLDNADFEVEENESRNFVANQFTEGVKIFEMMTHQTFGFLKTIGWDPGRLGIVEDNDEIEKRIWDFLKSLRYLVDNNNMLLTHKVRNWIRTPRWNPEKGLEERDPEYVTSTMAEDIASPEVREKDIYNPDERPEFTKKDQETRMSLNYLAAFFSTEFEFFRKKWSGHNRIGLQEFRLFSYLLTHELQQSLRTVMKNGRPHRMVVNTALFTHHQFWHKIVEPAVPGGELRMEVEELGVGQAESGFSSIIEVFKQFFKQFKG